MKPMDLINTTRYKKKMSKRIDNVTQATSFILPRVICQVICKYVYSNDLICFGHGYVSSIGEIERLVIVLPFKVLFTCNASGVWTGEETRRYDLLSNNKWYERLEKPRLLMSHSLQRGLSKSPVPMDAINIVGGKYSTASSRKIIVYHDFIPIVPKLRISRGNY